MSFFPLPCSRTLSAWLMRHPVLDLTGYSISELFIYFTNLDSIISLICICSLINDKVCFKSI